MIHAAFRNKCWNDVKHKKRFPSVAVGETVLHISKQQKNFVSKTLFVVVHPSSHGEVITNFRSQISGLS